MKPKYTHVLTLIGIILAFVSMFAMDYLLDSYVMAREGAIAEERTARISSQIELGLDEAFASLRRMLASNSSLCTPFFVASMQSEIESSYNLKQILVESVDGVQYCDAFGRHVTYSQISDPLPIPEHAATLSAVKLASMVVPALKITQAIDSSHFISAFIPLASRSEKAFASILPAGSMLRFVLSDGKPAMVVGDSDAFDNRSSAAEYIQAQSYAGEFPLRVEYAVPFATAWAGHAGVIIAFTLVVCGFGAITLLFVFNHVRRSHTPNFDLERAIARGDIKPYYQPVINLRTGAITGCEVLCRWEKCCGQIVMPGIFIAYAEATGLAIPMTLSLMQKVCADLDDLCRILPDLKISMNLFEGHFRDGSIVEDVQAIFEDSAINFRQLVFEITERNPLVNSAMAKSVIAGLHALGARLAIDDMGTGHSNLAYLCTLGIDIIKIDRLFVDMVKPETAQVPVLDGLIAMARDMGCDIVAEGVETEAQAHYLRDRGVIHAQGFIFAPALKATAFCELATALATTPIAAHPKIQETVATAA